MVPGHGEVLFGKDRVKDWIRWEASYLASVREAVREALDAGIPAEGRNERRSLAIVQAGYESAQSGEIINLRERFGEL